jgi:PAS domain S-box-containing protein
MMGSLVSGPVSDLLEPSSETARVAAAPTAPTPWPVEAVLAEVAAHPDDLRQILAASPHALVAFDAGRRILFANRGAEALFGYDAGALDGLSTDVLVAERFRQPDAPPMTPVPHVVQVDLAGVRRDGTELSVEWAFAAVPTPGGAVFIMTVRDRDAVDRAIDALRASEERFRLLVEGVEEYAIFTLDEAGRVSSWNKGAERCKGWTSDEIVGRPFDVFLTPEDRAAGVPAALLEADARKGSHEVTAWRVRKDGSRFFASAHLTALRSPTGELRGFAKITHDLSSRVQAEELERRLTAERAGREAAEAAEERVRASEDRLRRLQQVTAALSEALTPADVAAVVIEETMTALGARAGAVYGVSADGKAIEILDQRGHPTEPLATYHSIPLEFRSPLTDAARDMTPGFYDSFEACAALYPELRDAIRSGGFEASAAVPLVAHGVVLGVLGIRFAEARRFEPSDRSMLLTLARSCAQALERARLYDAERAARAEAEAANRSKDEFLAMLGHELRNPLAPIVTALSLMDLRDGDAPQRARAVIGRQVSHLVRLVDDLLDVSRIARGKVELKKEIVEIAVVVARAVELASPLLEQQQHHLAVSVPDRGLAVLADPTRLAQAVSNLLSNAAKYTPPVGHIEVSASRAGERVVLAVRDDGVGITPAMLPRVFELFVQERQTIARSQGGLGLGLAIVDNLVKMHDGKVSAFSEGAGRGSVFHVDLPAAAVLPDAVASSSPRRASSAGRRVLVVDDNADAAELLFELLSAIGHEVEIAFDGPRALELVDTFVPDVALLDIGLPVMDGYELARRLRGRLDGVRLVAVTGYGQESDRQRALDAGFHAHVVKPVELDALQAAIA